MSDALLVVDIQNDFCPGGALPVPNGDEVIGPLNRMMRYAKKNGFPVFASRDWHLVRTRHFIEFGGTWPPHCIQGTRGAEFHPSLHLGYINEIISKGMEYESDAYSIFQGRNLQGEVDADFPSILRDWGVETLYIGGLATDYCVKATVLDALTLGFRVVVLTDACRAVNVNPGDGERALKEMKSAGAMFKTTDELINFVA
ncbi:MAG: hypothetical protein A2934_00690 [Candidatus Sungbacteria bacterium RIFCSPLOWO2_01_FULL_47_10]|uniref:nicotinamidase n=1 Tax=Candidatus Sungbacteria bacterium RIFCSPLOWO2_01_FULL_47_10 TaxID=1802276 RepID=A0A1G2L3V4_9BACT|nr:MAG: hypothetical protein A2934_00690 [Candidatus Sungbacteria bacterium RIFCSPLOWO2_01_FULL_47_10]